MNCKYVGMTIVVNLFKQSVTKQVTAVTLNTIYSVIKDIVKSTSWKLVSGINWVDKVYAWRCVKATEID
jgi:hypothetical protein